MKDIGKANGGGRKARAVEEEKTQVGNIIKKRGGNIREEGEEKVKQGYKGRREGKRNGKQGQKGSQSP